MDFATRVRELDQEAPTGWRTSEDAIRLEEMGLSSQALEAWRNIAFGRALDLEESDRVAAIEAQVEQVQPLDCEGRHGEALKQPADVRCAEAIDSKIKAAMDRAFFERKESLRRAGDQLLLGLYELECLNADSAFATVSRVRHELSEVSELDGWFDYFRARQEYAKSRHEESLARIRNLLEALPPDQLLLRVRSARLGALSARVLGRPFEAKELFERALAAARALGDEQEIADQHASLAIALGPHLGDWASAWSHIDEALNRLGSISRSKSLFRILEAAGRVALHNGLEAAALLYFQESTAVGERIGPAAFKEDAYRRWTLASVRLAQQSEASAERRRWARSQVDQALDGWEVATLRTAAAADEHSTFLAHVQRERRPIDALVANARGEPRQAIEQLSLAIEGFERAKSPERLPELLRQRARLERGLGYLDAAAVSLDRALSLLDTLERPEKATFGFEHVTYFDLSQNLFEDRIALALDMHDAEAAFLISDRARSHVLLDRLRSSGLRGDSEAEVAASLEVIQGALPPDTGVLAFHFVGDSLESWWLRGGGVRERAFEHRTLGDVDSIEETIGAAAGLLPYPPSEDESLLQMAELREHLLAPWADRLVEVKRLAVLPHRELFAVPFSALWSEADGFLIETHTVFTSPSATVLAGIGTNRIERHGGEVIAIAYPGDLGDAPLTYLENAEDEARRVVEIHGGATLLGPEATHDGVCRAIGAAGVLHIAAHAVQGTGIRKAGAEPGREFWPHLNVAGEPSRLTVQDILLTCGTAPELVVLSACSTGDGELTTTEGPISLAWPFLARGSKVVVASLWDVEDGKTYELMEDFHEELAKGTDPAEALRRAQLKVQRRAEERGSGWSYWAGFQVLGNL